MLLRRKDELTPLLRRHGIHLRVDVLEDPARDLWSGVGLGVEDSAPDVVRELDRALRELEEALG